MDRKVCRSNKRNRVLWILVMCVSCALVLVGIAGCSKGNDNASSTIQQEALTSMETITPMTAFSSQERVLWYEVIWGVGKDAEIIRLHIVENGEVTTYWIGPYSSLTLGDVAQVSDDEIIAYVEQRDAELIDEMGESVKKGPFVAQAVIRTDNTGNAVAAEGIIDSEMNSTIGEDGWIYKSTIIGEEWLDSIESASEVYSSTFAGFRAPAGDTHLSLVRKVNEGMTFSLDTLNSTGVLIAE